MDSLIVSQPLNEQNMFTVSPISNLISEYTEVIIDHNYSKTKYLKYLHFSKTYHHFFFRI